MFQLRLLKINLLMDF